MSQLAGSRSPVLGALAVVAALALGSPVRVVADGQFHARQIDERNGVPILELTGTYDTDLPGNVANAEPREAVAQEFFRTHADDYDFLIVFTSFQFQTSDGIAFHWAVRNDVQGIGLPPVDLGAEFGSAARLKGYVDMPALSLVETDPLKPEFEQTLSILSHELLHQWVAHVRFRASDGSPSADLLGRGQSHWSFLFDSGASVQYGNAWHDNGDGTFTSTAAGRRYGPLDLYLAGFLRPDEVPPLRLLQSAGVDVTRLPEPGVTLSATARTVTVDDIVAVEGARLPDAEHAQHAFRAAMLYLTRPGDVVTEAQLAALDRIRRAAATHFAALTAGRGSLAIVAEGKPEDGGTPAGDEGGEVRSGPASLADAYAWLRSRQTAAGYWEDDPATRGRDTAIVLPVLTAYDTLFDPARRAAARDWLEAGTPANVDDLARAAAVLASATRREELDARRNADGGWGLGPGYASDVPDTAYAAAALAGTPASAGASERLLGWQNADGGWPNVPGGASRTAPTTAALQALRALDGTAAHAPAVDRAFAWLATKQNPDGGFGDSPSTAHDTAVALLAAIDFRRTAALRAGDAAGYLGSHQTVAGGWEGSAATTAVAAAALARFDLPNWRFAGPLRLAPSQPRDGDRVAVEMSVVSDGRVGTPAGTLRLFDGDPAQGVPIGPDIAMPALASGTSATLGAVWDTLDEAGPHTLVAVLDPDGQVEQSTRSDDATTLAVTVAAAASGPELELRGVDLTATPPHPTTLPIDVVVAARVRNNGRTDAPAVRVRLLEGSTQLAEETVAVAQRSFALVSFDYPLTGRGARLLTVVVDPLAEIDEADETNNSATIAIAAEATVDLAVAPADLRLEAPAFVGADATFVVSLRNLGTDDAPSVPVAYTVTDGTTTRTLPAGAVAIPAGGALTRSVTWRVDLAGDLSFAVALDPAATVADVDRTNNQATLAFHASAGVELNLVVGRGDLAVDPAPGREGAPLAVTATVHNVGTSAADGVEVAFFDGDPEHGGLPLGGVQTLASVASGGAAAASVQLTRLTGAQQRLIYVVVDPAARLAEATREDNRTFVILDVLSLADPAVTGASLRLRPGVPVPGQPVELDVAVQNLGQQDATDLMVRAYDGDPAHGGTPLAEQVVTATALATTPLTLRWTAAAGARAVFVVLDPEQTLDEASRANDTASLAYVSQDGDVVVTERLFSPNGDGVQDATELDFRLPSAATVAVEVLDRRGRVVRRSAPGSFEGVAQGRFVWNGLDDAGAVVLDGDYSLRVVAGAEEVGRALATVDTDRSPLSAAVGTPFASFTNLTCELPQMFDLFFSADEQALFFVGGQGFATRERDPLYPPTLYQMSPTGGGVRKLVPEDWFDQRSLKPLGMFVSADARRLVLDAGSQFGGASFFAPVDGSALPAALAIGVQYLGFAASSDVVVGLTETDLVAVHLPDATATSLWHFPDSGTWSGTLSPDRRWVLVTKDEPFGDDDTTWEAWIVGTEGQPAVALGSGRDAAWSPDSRSIALVRAGDAMVFGVDGTLRRRFVPPVDEGEGLRGSSGDLSWSSNGEQLSIVARYGDRCDGGAWRRVLVADLPSGTVETVVQSDAVQGCGKRPRATARRRTRAVAVRGAAEASLVDDAALDDVVWAPNDAALVAFHEGDGSTSLLIPLDGRPVQPLLAAFDSVAHARFSPTGRGLLFDAQDETFEACHDTLDPQQVLFRSLMNLTADLRVRPVVGAAGFLLEGSAADLHFLRFTLDYASAAAPASWSPIAPPSSTQVLDAPFTTWVAPAPGTYLIRLRVEDAAGNVRAVTRTVSSTAQPILDRAFVAPRYFSPNGDGVLDRATLSYRLLAPAHFDVRIFDGERRLVRLIPQDRTEVGQTLTADWDGRDDAGRLVADGTYTVELLGYTFPVTVAARPLQVSMRLDKAMQCVAAAPPVPLGVAFSPSLLVEPSGSAASPVALEVESGDGPAPLLWTPAAGGALTEAQYDGKSFRARVVDQAGNTAVAQVPPGPAEFFFVGLGSPEVDSRTEALLPLKPIPCGLPAGLGPVVALREPRVRVAFAESVQPPLESIAVEYQAASMAGGAVDAAIGHLTDTWERAELSEFFLPGERLPVTRLPDTFVDAEWTAPTSSGGALALRFRATDAVGGVWTSPIVFVTLPALVELDPFLASSNTYGGLLDDAGLHPPADAVVGLTNLTGVPLENVLLTVQSTEDPRFRAPVAYTPMASSPTQFLFASTDWRACTEYTLRALAESVPVLDPATGASTQRTFTVSKTARRGCVALDASLKREEQAGDVCALRPPDRRTVVLTPHTLDGTPLQLLTVEGPNGALFSLPNPAAERQVEVTVATADLPGGGSSLRCRLTNGAGQEAVQYVEVFVASGPPQGLITYPSDGATVCGVGNALEVRGQVSDALPGLQYGVILENAEERHAGGGIADRASVEGTLARFSVAGTFDAHLELKSAGGYGVCTAPIRFTVDALVEGAGVGRGERMFSPNGDGVQDTEAFTISAAEPARATAEVWPADRDPAGACVPRAGASPVLLPGEFEVGTGSAEGSWDGTAEDGPAAEGEYVFVAKLLDACGNTKQAVSDCFTLDRTAPEVRIDAPLETDVLGLIVPIRGTIVEPHASFTTVEYASASNLEVWTPIDRRVPPDTVPPPGPGRLLALWNTYGLAGDSVLRVRVGDLAGNVAEAQRRVTLASSGGLLTDLGAEPRAFSPNGDGRLDGAALRFALDAAATVTLQVVDRGGQIVRTLVQGELRAAGAGQIVWDGRSGSGAVVPDGEYAVVIEAQAAGNAAIQDRQQAPVLVDTTPPSVDVLRPVADGFVGAAGGVLGTVTDPLLVGWSVELAPGPAGPWTTLGTGTQEVGGATLAPLAGLAEGSHAVRVQARDEAGNVTERVVAFSVDTRPPVVALTAPGPGSFVGSSLAPVDVTGTWVEEHPKSWRLEVGAGVAPSVWQPIASGAGAAPAALAGWNPQALPDGDWTLRFLVEDAAGQIGDARAPVVIDNTPPTAEIVEPAEGGTVTGTRVITGTASDAHLAGYELSVATSLAPTFSAFGAGTTSVVHGALWRWSALPADGNATLKLEATDRAGNRTTALRAVRVHTRPPAPPLQLSATVELRDVHLTWSPSAGPDVVGYRLYRAGTPLPGTVAGTAAIDPGLAEGSHTYQVSAVDEDGLESPRSNEVTVRVDVSAPLAELIRPLPNTPQGGVVDVIGTASSPQDFREYRLFAIAPGGAALLRRSNVPRLASVLGQWSTLGLPEGSVATLRLESEDLGGNVAVAEVDVTVDNVAPAAPVNLAALVDADTVHLTWAANGETDLAGYLLYRDGRLANAHGPVVGDLTPYVLASASYDDTTVPDGAHAYTVVAIDRAANQSPPSEPVAATVETRAPHAVFAAPVAEEEFQDALHVLATTVDEDVARVQLAWRFGAGAWTDFAPLTVAPWELTWETSALAFGDFELRAIATDRDGHADPDPPTVLVHHRYLAAPPAAKDLQAHVVGGEVSLTWLPGEPAPSDLAGYWIDRVDPEGAATRLNVDPWAATSYTDTARPDGAYAYSVTAVNTHGNVSEAVEVEAVVGTPALVQAYTPTAASTTALEGTTFSPGATMSGTRIDDASSAPFGPVDADAAGGFAFAAVPLASGEQTLRVIATDGAGNVSKPAQVSVLRVPRPSPPSGLAAVETESAVSLSWSPNPPAENVVGYRILRDGAPSPLPSAAAGVQASASTPDVGSPQSAAAAVDGDPLTFWRPEVGPDPLAGQALEVRLPSVAQVAAVELAWTSEDVDGQIVVHGPGPFWLEGWDGSVWVPLARPQATPAPSLRLDLPQPYRTDRVRVRLTAASDVPELAEVRVLVDTLHAETTVSDVPTGGLHAYRVIAVGPEGIESGPSEEASVRFGVPPEPVTLAGTAIGSEVDLAWTASPSPNVVSYELLRDGQPLALVTDVATRTYADLARPNGTWRYTVRPIDARGSVGALSNEAVVVVAAPLPAAPLLAVTAVPTGGALDLAWSPGSPSPPAAGYRIRRAEVPGGPYAALATTAGLTYRDATVVDGRTYYYVVEAFDALANTGPTSNEASGTPRDGALPEPPVLHFPAWGAPFTTDENAVAVAGTAEPGVTVVLSGSGTHTATAAAQDEALSAPVGTPALPSPDGRYLLLPVFGTVRIFDLEGANGGSTIDLPVVADGATWMADGLGLVTWAVSSGGDEELSTYRFARGESAYLTTFEAIAGVAASPDGRRIAVAGRRGGSDGIWIGDLFSGAWSLRGPLEPGTVDGASLVWSPGATRLAFVATPAGSAASPGLLVLAAEGSAPVQVVDPAPAESRVSFLPDDSMLLARAAGAGSEDLVRRTADGVEAPLAEGLEPPVLPQAGPDGRSVAYREGDGVTLLELAAGQTRHRVVDTGVEDLRWVPGGHLFALGAESVRLSIAGRFRIAGVALPLGETTLTAKARDGAGNVGGASSPRVVRRVAANLPDLSVAPSDLTVLPALPIVGGAARWTVVVRNVGPVASAPATMSITLEGPQGAHLGLASGLPVPALGPGEESAAAGEVTMPGGAGDWTLVAEVDPQHRLPQLRRDNDVAARGFRLVEEGHPTVALGVDRPSYLPADVLHAGVTVFNGSASFHGSVALRIEDPQGEPAGTLAPLDVPTLAPGQSLSGGAQSGLAELFAGDYRLVARLLDETGATVDTAAAPFAVVGVSTLDAAIETDRAVYVRGAAARLTAVVSYPEGNVALAGVRARMQVRRAGAVVAEWVHELGLLLPGSEQQLADDWLSAAAAAGTYEAWVALEREGAPGVAAAAPFSVVPAPIRLSGALSLSDRAPAWGGPLRAAYTVASAVEAVTALPVRVRVTDGGTSELLRAPSVVDVPAAGSVTHEAALDTPTLGLGRRLAVLEADVPGVGTVVLDSVSLEVVDRTPPTVTLAAPPAVTAPETELVASVNDALSPVAQVESSLDDGPWQRLDRADPSTGTYRRGLAALAEGPHTLVVRAADAAGNVATSPPRSFAVVTDAPTVQILGVQDGGLYGAGVHPAVVFSLREPGTKTVLLDGGPFMSGEEVAVEGEHLLVAAARDAMGREAGATAGFAIDLTPPAIQVTGVTDGALYGAPVTPSVAVTDAHLDGFTTTLDGQPWPDGAVVGIEGAHTLQVAALDRVAHQSALALSFTLDLSAPVIVVDGVSPGALYGHAVTPTIVVTDAHPGTSAVRLDGAAFASGTPVESDGDHALEVSATDAAGHAASAAVAFTIDRTPPAIAIAGVVEGSTYGDAVTPVVSVTDAHPGSTSADLDGASWTDGAPITGDGPHTFRVQAVDAAGNEATATVHFTIDHGAPRITVTGIENATLYGHAVTPIVLVEDPHPGTQSVTLDGAPFVSGTPVSAEGEHALHAEATNAFGSRAQTDVSFAIDLAAPVIAIAGVEDGARYSGAVTPLVAITDAHPGTSQTTLDGMAFVSGTPVAENGNHLLRVEATDAAGNGAVREVRFAIVSRAFGVPFYTVTPCRLVDTRWESGPWGGPPLAGAQARRFDLVGRCGLPADVFAVSLNVTVVDPSAEAFLTLYDADLPALPPISTLNVRPGKTRANNGVIVTSADGLVGVTAVLSNGTADLLLDVNGYFGVAIPLDSRGSAATKPSATLAPGPNLLGCRFLEGEQ